MKANMMKNKKLQTLAKMILENSKNWLDDDWSDKVNNCCVTYGERYGLTDEEIEFLAENWEILAEGEIMRVKYNGLWCKVDKITELFAYVRNNNGSIPRYGYAVPIEIFNKLEKRMD